MTAICGSKNRASSKSQNRWGDLDGRIMIENTPNKTDQEATSTLWYGGGNYDFYIDVPTLELA